MNRRSLFGAIALSPLMAASAFAKEEKKVTGQPLDDHANITLQGTKKRDAKIASKSNSPFMFIDMPQYDPSKRVSMAVGDDGNLWLKSSGGEWKRVVTE
jgi:hypothetical protein